jgi:hypothetical protein
MSFVALRELALFCTKLVRKDAEFVVSGPPGSMFWHTRTQRPDRVDGVTEDLPYVIETRHCRSLDTIQWYL